MPTLGQEILESHGLDIDPAMDNHPDFGPCSAEDLLKDFADHEAWLTGSRLGGRRGRKPMLYMANSHTPMTVLLGMDAPFLTPENAEETLERIGKRRWRPSAG